MPWLSTIPRSLASPVAGFDSSSATMSLASRPASRYPSCSRNSSRPFTISLPFAAWGPVIGASSPILSGGRCARLAEMLMQTRSPAATRNSPCLLMVRPSTAGDSAHQPIDGIQGAPNSVLAEHGGDDGNADLGRSDGAAARGALQAAHTDHVESCASVIAGLRLVLMDSDSAANSRGCRGVRCDRGQRVDQGAA